MMIKKKENVILINRKGDTNIILGYDNRIDNSKQIEELMFFFKYTCFDYTNFSEPIRILFDKLYFITHAFSNVTSYRCLFVQIKYLQSTGYLGVFAGSNLLLKSISKGLSSQKFLQSYQIHKYKRQQATNYCFSSLIRLLFGSFLLFFIEC